MPHSPQPQAPASDAPPPARRRPGVGTTVALMASCVLSLTAKPLTASDFPAPPEWTLDAVWYQIFPERFSNADPANDPTRASLNDPARVPASWKIRSWTGDWYERSDWERAVHHDFFSTVFERRYGGDLQGVIDKLDYFADLGINALYFNPIFHAQSLHKYDATSFHHIDPHFGPDPEGDLALIATEDPIDPETWVWTSADRLFLELIQEARVRGIRVIVDGVWNHTGVEFFAFRDLAENQRRSRFRDWFRVDRFDDRRTARNQFAYRGWHGFWQLPELGRSPDGLNLAHGPKQYIFAATRRWMDPDGDGDPSDGIDGWRLDVAEEVPVGFWREWHALVRRINPEAYTSAEIWGPAAGFVAENHFNAAMNYAGFAVPVKGFLIDAVIDAPRFAERLRRERETYPEAVFASMQNLIDSHDTQRVASAIVNRPADPANPGYEAPDWFDYDQADRVGPRGNADYSIHPPDEAGRRIWKIVALFQATYVGAPMIYYGTESGMWGADDPCDRMPMVWEGMDFAPIRHHPRNGRLDQAIPIAFDREIFDFYRAALRLRRDSPTLRRGEFELVEANGMTLAFKRVDDEGDTFLVLINRDESDYFRVPGFTLTRPVLATDPAITEGILPPLSAAVYHLTP